MQCSKQYITQLLLLVSVDGLVAMGSGWIGGSVAVGCAFRLDLAALSHL